MTDDMHIWMIDDRQIEREREIKVSWGRENEIEEKRP